MTLWHRKYKKPLIKMPSSFANKLALVTGGGSGIGRAVCQLLSHEGATVIVANNILETAQDTIMKCTLTSNQLDKHMAIELDVRSSNSVQSVLSTVLKTYDRPPSIVVNAAGIAPRKSLLKITESEYDDVIDTNMKGSFLVLQKFGKAMVEAEIADGSIVNVSSYLSRNGLEVNLDATNSSDGVCHYTASKAGILGITLGAAKELGRKNIRVNAVLPGLVQTPMISVIPKAVLDNYIKMNPLNRIGEPKDVAELIVFLCSSKSSYINGGLFDIDGGI